MEKYALEIVLPLCVIDVCAAFENGSNCDIFMLGKTIKGDNIEITISRQNDYCKINFQANHELLEKKSMCHRNYQLQVISVSYTMPLVYGNQVGITNNSSSISSRIHSSTSSTENEQIEDSNVTIPINSLQQKEVTEEIPDLNSEPSHTDHFNNRDIHRGINNRSNIYLEAQCHNVQFESDSDNTLHLGVLDELSLLDPVKSDSNSLIKLDKFDINLELKSQPPSICNSGDIVDCSSQPLESLLNSDNASNNDSKKELLIHLNNADREKIVLKEEQTVFSNGNENNIIQPKLVCNCRYTGKSQDALNTALHIIFYHREEPNYSKICEYFDYISNCNSEAKKTMQCSRCNHQSISSTIAAVRKHLVSVHSYEIDFNKITKILEQCAMRDSVPNGKLQCQKCKTYYSSYKAAHKHFSTYHDKSQLPELLADIRIQMKQAKANGWFDKSVQVSCHECGYKFKYGHGITHHIKLLHHGDPTLIKEADESKGCGPYFINNICYYSCKLCEEHIGQHGIITHLKSKHSDEMKLEEILLYYMNRIQHYSNICKDVSRNSIYAKCKKVCVHCKRSFTSGNHTKHLKICKMNPDRVRMYHCYCGYRSEIKDKVASHKLSCDKKKPMTLFCETCGKQFGSRGTLCMHKREKHQIGRIKPVEKWTCSICSKSFWRKQAYEKHLFIHSDTKDFMCDICGKAFATPASLSKHQDTQHRDRFKYRCLKCGHGLEKEKYLKTHKCARVRRKPNQCNDTNPEDELNSGSSLNAPKIEKADCNTETYIQSVDFVKMECLNQLSPPLKHESIHPEENRLQHALTNPATSSLMVLNSTANMIKQPKLDPALSTRPGSDSVPRVTCIRMINRRNVENSEDRKAKQEIVELGENLIETVFETDN